MLRMQQFIYSVGCVGANALVVAAAFTILYPVQIFIFRYLFVLQMILNLFKIIL